MVFIRIATVGGKRYVQMGDYYKLDGKRKLKLIKSFGLENTQSVREAEAFLSIYMHFKKLKKENPLFAWEEYFKIAISLGNGILATYLGAECLKWIYDHDEKGTQIRTL